MWIHEAMTSGSVDYFDNTMKKLNVNNRRDA